MKKDYGDYDGNLVPYVQAHGAYSDIYKEYHSHFGRNAVCSTKEIDKILDDPSVLHMSEVIRAMKARVGEPSHV